MEPFVITGCGRSGTRYVSHLLSSNKVPTGWEATLKPGKNLLPEDYTALLRFLGIQGDSNWFLVGYLNQLPTVKVYHLVRHPLSVVRSMLGLRFFGDDYFSYEWHGESEATAFVEQFIQLRQYNTAIERCLAYWLYWNLLLEEICEKRSLQLTLIKMEQMLSEPDPFVRQFIEVDSESSIVVPSKNHNQVFYPGDRKLFWDEIPNSSLKEEALVKSKEYGYE